MELNHRFTVPVPPEQAFAILQDIERIGPCMPGATITSVEGSSFSGKVKVKLGPMQMTYAGDAEYTDVDPDALKATIVARGREQRGAGTADAKVYAHLTAHADGTEVVVVTDLAITGKPAQFGRGVMEDVGGRLLDQFAACLAEELASPQIPEPAEPAESAEPSADEPADAEPMTSADEPDGDEVRDAPPVTPNVTPRPPRVVSEPDPVDLLEVAGAPILKRLAPVVLGLLALTILRRVLRRR